jgi:peptide deformylase
LTAAASRETRIGIQTARWSSEERSTYEEGCLSIPEYYAEDKRPGSVRARALDREGKEREIPAEGLLATVLQHEVDISMAFSSSTISRSSRVTG